MGEKITWTNEKRKLRDLIPWEHNPRQINKKEAERLGDSLDEFGQIQTIAIGPDNSIYDGHQRQVVWGILPKYGRDFEVDVRVSSRLLTEKERQKLVVYLHKGATGDWNIDELANSFEIDDLLDWGFEAGDFELDWGNDDEETPDPGAQVDKAEVLLEKWGVNEGDIWQCGEHFIICADCREPETWTRLLDAAGVGKVNGIFTSPPYAEQRKKQYGGVPVDEYVEWWDAVQSLARAHLAEDGSFFVNIKPHCEKGQRVLYVFDLVLAMVRRWGWRFVDELYWKRQGTPGAYTSRFKNVIEGVYHFSLQEKFSFHSVNVLGEFKGDYKKLNSSEHPQRPSSSGSGFKTGYGNEGFARYEKDGALPGNMIEANQGATVKDTGAAQAATFPVQLPSFFIKAYSDTGDLWCDPFLGSGTTIAAAEKHGRRGIGIERLPRYVSVVLERLTDMGLNCALLG